MFDKSKPLFVFNLVEEEENIAIAPIFLENCGVLHTGCPGYTIQLTNNKILFKEIFRFIFEYYNINLPSYVFINNTTHFKESTRYIIKAIDKNSSIDMDDNAVIMPKSKDHLIEILEQKKIKTGIKFFAEEFIDGREFNVPILNGEILPISEIVFKDYPPDKVKIVGYSAKWDNDSFEYTNTVRNFKFDERDSQLIDKIKEISLICSDKLMINGYHRLDFRVDNNNTPYLLEINANPCLSKDAGFYASCKEKGYSYNQMINQIINEMYHYSKNDNKNILAKV
jgi:D-alanine-D-alanine ligase